MVLGMRSKNRRPTTIQVDYTIHIQEIKPWPPSQSLKSLKSVVLQWENGDRSSGSTSPVSPSQSKIEFNESFNLHVTFVKESSGKKNEFQKNVLELSLYEPRRDKSAKGQLLGNAAVDLAELGIVKDVVSFGVPLNSKRSYRNTAQPMIYVKIQAFDKEGSSVSPSASFRESLSKVESLDGEGAESVSALMNGEYAEEAEIASFTDDDVSSHSSLGNLASASETNTELASQSSPEQQKEADAEKENKERINLLKESVSTTQELESITTCPIVNATSIPQDRSLPQVIDAGSSDNGDNSSSTSPLEKPDVYTTHSSPSSATCEGVLGYDLHKEFQDKVVSSTGGESVLEESRRHAAFENQTEMLEPKSTERSELSTDDIRSPESKDHPKEDTGSDDARTILVADNIKEQHRESGLEEKTEVVDNHSIDTETSASSSPDNSSTASRESLEHSPVVQHKYLQNALRKPVSSDVATSGQRLLGEKSSRSLTSDRLKNMHRSMRSPPHSFGGLENLRHAAADQCAEHVKEIDVSEDQERVTLNSGKVKHASRGNMNNVPNNKVRELELRVEMLEGELREAAAIEISVYSIVAEHGSSVNKVHTPARRLSRLYIHASKKWSRERKASAARSAVSGLVLAAKACGNDVPRLTFWLSNTIVLRAIVTGAVGNSDISSNVRLHSASNGSRVMTKGNSSPLKWESFHRKKETSSLTKGFDDWGDLSTFTAALERVESWMFSRVIESIWWQTLTPHMQSINESSEHKPASNKEKNFGRKPSLGDKKNENFSLEVWKKAFSTACERLCPVRAEGHECGCLPMLARLVMEQCVARLDVAMFNAILRESADEIPTDPVSDPISDPKVLPIPPGKSSFGAGAQLKNAIGNWSRWLTDLFGMDTDESLQDKNDEDDDRVDIVETFKSFRLLNALSDLLMLPKDMLMEKSIRREVCPTFSTSMIRRILGNFLPDEFCPDVIPAEVLEALDSEDGIESDEEEIRHYPCNASPISYSAPAVASVENIIGDVRTTSVLRRSGSSVVRKCHTSDDELDELDSPLSSIMLKNSFTPAAMSMGNMSANVVRYQLLRDVWRSDD